MTRATPTGSGPSVAADAAGALPAGARRGWSIPAIPAPWMFSGLITLFLVVGQFFFDIVGGYERLALALGAAIATELVLSKLVRGQWPNILSAYISGNSIVILTKPTTNLIWPFVVGSMLAITSKYVLSYRGKHLWNPTNFAISALLLLAPGSMAVLSHQWGNNLTAVMLVFGVGMLVVWRAKLLHISLTYLLCFLALAGVRSAINGDPWLAEISPVTGPMYQLLMFFMLTDPRTVVGTRSGRMLVVALIALVECLIRLLPLVDLPALNVLTFAPPIFALAIVGPIAKWIDIRRQPAAPRPAPVRAAA